MLPPKIPRATYRLQLHRDFKFAQAEAVVPYLAALGISHLYVSPILKARAGSQHGYDIIDHNALNPELGDRAAFERLCARLAEHGMGLVVDFVPNHMGVGGADNGWWLDVLEWGEDSPYARFFDIDWQPPRRELKGKVLLPFLGDHYGAILERGELVPKFDRDEGTLSVWYWDHRYPIAVRDYPDLLQAAARAGAGDDLLDVVLDFRALAAGQGGRSAQSRRSHAVQCKARLAGLVALRPDLAEAVDAALATFAQDPTRLHDLLERQSYRVSFWRVAADEINYRRFFDRSGRYAGIYLKLRGLCLRLQDRLPRHCHRQRKNSDKRSCPFEVLSHFAKLNMMLPRLCPLVRFDVIMRFLCRMAKAKVLSGVMPPNTLACP